MNLKNSKQSFLSIYERKPTIVDGWGIQRQLRNHPEIIYQQIGVNRI